MCSLFAAESDTSAFTPNVAMSQEAIASPDYIVTPGDIYTLYMHGSSISVTIDSSYKLRVGNLGVINAKGMTFQELKNRVENLVINNYPTATVQFVITNPADFKVIITGEVTYAGEVTTWSLKRLSEVISGRLTSYASTRQIIVEASDGTQKKYDLFQATRFGNMSQNPYLRPGDKIIIPKYDRKVSISGAVRRPGTYELLPGEQIQDLINVYAEGYTDYANKNELTLSRFIGGNEVWEKKNLTEADVVADITLFDKDSVVVLQYSLTRSVFYVEGSVAVGTINSPAGFNRHKFEYTVGLNYPTFIKEHKGWFTNNSADLENAYIKRTTKDKDSGEEKEEIIKIDINKVLYGSGFYEDLIVQSNDVLFVPFIQYYVTVNGAVAQFGIYPYVAGKTYEYYVNLAGGFNVNQNILDAVTIKTKDGKKLSKKSIIPPEAVITAKANSPSGNGWFMPIIVTILTVISTLLSCFVAIHEIGWI